MKPPISDIQAVLSQFDQSDWDELHINNGDFSLHVSKSPMTGRPQRSLNSEHPPAAVRQFQSQHATDSAPSTASGPVSMEASGSQSTGTSPDNSRRASEGTVVKAPSLGTFYRSPNPGADPFVEVGTRVDSATQLCLLEVMKLYTAVEAGVGGVITEILVEDGALVEHDQPLFVILSDER